MNLCVELKISLLAGQLNEKFLTTELTITLLKAFVFFLRLDIFLPIVPIDDEGNR